MALVLNFRLYCTLFNLNLKTNLKRLSLFALSSVVTLLMSCSGNSNSGSGEQQESSEGNNPPASTEQESSAPSPELAAQIETGKQVYTQYCLVCHQADGRGVQGAFPPLNQSEWVNGDNKRLISVILNGLQGPIEVKGEQYNGMMPSHSFLTDEQIAGVLTYVRNSFDNEGGEITVEEVKEAREAVGTDSASSN